jgi:hypothetical protein
MKNNKFVGTWRFESMKAETPKGEIIYPYGENLFSRLIYTSDGHMFVLLMRPDRPKFASDDPLGGTKEEIKEAYEEFDAYCGTYKVDEENRTVTHYVEGSKFPNWVGTNQVRSFKFSDNRLFFTAVLQVKGEPCNFEAILTRL